MCYSLFLLKFLASAISIFAKSKGCETKPIFLIIKVPMQAKPLECEGVRDISSFAHRAYQPFYRSCSPQNGQPDASATSVVLPTSSSMSIWSTMMGITIALAVHLWGRRIRLE